MLLGQHRQVKLQLQMRYQQFYCLLMLLIFEVWLWYKCSCAVLISAKFRLIIWTYSNHSCSAWYHWIIQRLFAFYGLKPLGNTKTNCIFSHYLDIMHVFYPHDKIQQSQNVLRQQILSWVYHINSINITELALCYCTVTPVQSYTCFLWSSKSFTLPQPANHFFIKLNLLRVINT